ncbi:DUF2971 domain-containing protein [Photobacterium sp. GB-56]|uniref:DUF2971 domain-containing protein n=1 Tax=Photobacterium sp. GB-56 TaxID=2022106 RepID=UPI000D1853B3|nr:DUF2971 domain-containing protein [Photobacterium sp. GB-56]PSV27080.1 hypothetical protein C9J42_09440 [Photobacterium sp. GB-56]
MSIIYHYCDLNAFISIAKNKKLWLSDATKMNDYLELKFFRNTLETEINKRLNISDEKEYINSYIEFYNLLGLSTQIPYICCFSTNGDLLSQWRAYGNDGKGVSIGFDKNKFPLRLPLDKDNQASDFINSNYSDDLACSYNVKSSIGFKKIDYGIDKARLKINEILSLIQLSQESSDDNVKTFTRLTAQSNALNSTFSIKNSGFSEESEIRLIYTPLQMHKDGKICNVPNEISSLQYRSIGDDIVSYYEYNFCYENTESPIIELVIGPKCKMTIEDVQYFLGTCGITGVKITKAQSSYR